MSDVLFYVSNKNSRFNNNDDFVLTKNLKKFLAISYLSLVLKIKIQ